MVLSAGTAQAQLLGSSGSGGGLLGGLLGSDGLLGPVVGDDGLLGSVVGSSDPATLRIVPASAVPGTQIRIYYTAPSDALLEVSILDHIECWIEAPDGGQLALCSEPTRLLEIKLLGSGDKEYAFAITAPSLLGTYTVRFQAVSLLSVALPPQNLAAAGQFLVVAPTPAPPGPTPTPGPDPTPVPDPSPTPGPDPTPTPAPGPDDDSGGNETADGAGSGSDAIRFLVSQLAAGTVVVVALIAGRGKLGGML